MSDDATLVRKILANRKNYYTVLGVTKTTTAVDVKRAYKQLALRCHPDKNTHPQAAEAFKLLNAANTVLGDPAKKRTYDRHGEEGMQREESGASPAAPQRRHHQGQGDLFEDIFNLFAGTHPSQQQRRPQQPQYQSQQQQQQQYQQQQQQQQRQRQQYAQNDTPDINMNFLMMLPFVIFLLFAYMLQSGGIEGALGGGGGAGGGHRDTGRQQAGKSLFSLTRRDQDNFVVLKTTAVHEVDPQVDFYVKRNFPDMLRRYAMSQRSVELLALEAWKNHLERRCQSEVIKQRDKPGRAKAVPHSCSESRKYRSIPRA
jgi:DnaJ family protein B protein 12